tara:strand:+ start:1143 stop:1442 length:300 start_codon:yes stop_codon:yes gene_type:complete
MFDLRYYYTLKKKQDVMRMVQEFRSIGWKHQRTHLDGMKHACLNALQSVNCLSYERVFFRDVMSHADELIEITTHRTRKKFTCERMASNLAPSMACGDD